MSELLVEEVLSAEQKPTKKGGTFTKYLLRLKDAGTASFADFESVRPTEGMTFTNHEVRDDGYGPEIKKLGSAPRNGTGPKASGKSPAEQKSITRQGAEQRAALYLIAKAMVKQHLDQDLTREDFKKLCDWFVEDATV